MYEATMQFDPVLQRRAWRRPVSGSCRRSGRGASGPRSA